MKTFIERECPNCKYTAWAAKGAKCPLCHKAIMAKVIRFKIYRRIVGVLCRDKSKFNCYICFMENLSSDLKLDEGGHWYANSAVEYVSCWNAKEWQQKYGKLPRKGSKEIVILELSDDVPENPKTG